MTTLKRLLAVLAALTLLAAACSNDDDDTATDDTASEAADETSTTEAAAEETPTSDAATEEESEEGAAAPVAKPTLAVTAVSFTDNTVTVRNDGAEAVDLTGYSICNRPNYAGAPAASIEPGATLDIDVSEIDIRGSGGEFGLYTSNSFDSADALVAYVQWGGPTNGRASVAVEAGLIADGEFVDNGGEDFTVG